ncbi:MAG: hypothetical protein JW825_04080 [Candidatus Methanofastidiosa archaeon]|nr:hypothetical protein [Candidatus Methanofastidiosa archaeon]
MAMKRTDLVSMLFIIWTAILILFASDADISLFIILLFIGFLILRELFDNVLSNTHKDRLNFYLYLGIIFFAITVIEKVMAIIG